MDQNYPQAKVLKIANTIKALSKTFIFTLSKKFSDANSIFLNLKN